MLNWFMKLFEPSERQLCDRLSDITKNIKLYSSIDTHYFTHKIPNKETSGGIKLNYVFDKVEIMYSINLNKNTNDVPLFEIKYSNRSHETSIVTKSKKIMEKDAYDSLVNVVKILLKEEERLKDLYYKDTKNISKMLENFR